MLLFFVYITLLSALCAFFPSILLVWLFFSFFIFVKVYLYEKQIDKNKFKFFLKKVINIIINKTGEYFLQQQKNNPLL